MPVANGASRRCQNFQKVVAVYTIYMKRCTNVLDFVLVVNIPCEPLTIEQGSKTLICISFTKLNIHLLLERVFLNFSGYSSTVTQIQANATKRLRQFRNRFHFSRDAKQIYEKTYYSYASSVVSTVTPLLHWSVSGRLAAVGVRTANFLIIMLVPEKRSESYT
ncbi:hypothetical protein CSKR_113703 [Clonorchis sinensis]|uniref:Uncharacterized protein n=1 Tax=Clonorchis sinensis TaxID=79923 RepID=A0A419PNS3_CLOSI|nr:hypothetical protein CSKR_113703 [Clonorchis sinensis]